MSDDSKDKRGATLQPVRHGILAAALESDFTPALDCVCGYTAIGSTWEQAGEKFDEHLEKDEPR